MKFYSVSIEGEPYVPINQMSIKQLETLCLCFDAGVVRAEGTVTVQDLRDQVEIWLSAMAMVS